MFATVCLGLSPQVASAQLCDGQEGALPDTPVEVGGNGSVAGNPEVTCFYFRFDSDITGFPTGITMDLWHEYEGDLGIFVEACGERLNVLQRPGAVGNCSADCAFNVPGGDCGSSAMIGTEDAPETINFFETGTEPDDGVSLGGSYGLTLDDDCGVGTLPVNSFAELWSNCPAGLVEAEICFADHATLHQGYVSNLNFIFPNPYECGCMDETALNYNPDASVSSGDCLYECPDRVVEIISMPDPPVLCQGIDTITLTANTTPMPNDPSYQWIGTGLGNDFLSDAEAQTTQVYIPADFIGSIVYTAIVTDEFNCSSQESITVTVNPSAVVDIIGQDFVCGNDSTELILQGGPFDSVMWSTGDMDTDTITVGAGTYEVTVSSAGLCDASASFTVAAFPASEPMIAGPDTICYTDTVWLSVDTVFTSYAWSNGGTSSSIYVNTPGLYTVEVVDTNGCVGIDTFQLSHFDTLQLAIVGPGVICPGDSIVLSAQSGLSSYQWSTGDTTSQITIYSPGLIELTAVDSNSCVASTSVVIQGLSAPQPQILGPLALCPDETVQLTVSETYAAYQWSGGGDGNSIMTDMAGMYEVTVIDTLGCSGSTSFLLEPAQAPSVSLNHSSFICQEDQATIIADPNLGTYSWSTGDTTSTVTVPGPGSYDLTVTNPQGCSTTAVALIEPFVTEPPLIGGDAEICPDGSTTLIASGPYTNYQWQDGTMGDQLVVDQVGVYTVQAIDGNDCQVEASFTVDAFDAPEVTITGVSQICENGSGIIEATAGFTTYSWSAPNGDQASLTVSAADTYQVTVTDTNGCQATASQTVSLSIPDPELTGFTAFCDGGSTFLSVADTFMNYQWSGGVFVDTYTIEVNTPGIYSLTVTDNIGCEAIAAVDVTENPLPVPEITGELAFCEGSITTLTADAGYQAYEWSIPGNNEAQLQVFDAGSFSVTVTDVNGCQGSTDAETSVIPLPTPEIEGDLNFCPGGNTTLFTTEEYVSYDWSTGSSTFDTEVMTGDLVTLTVVDSNSCAATVTAQPEVYSVLTPIIDGAIQFCIGDSTTLTANAGYDSYSWSNGQTGPTATFSDTGIVTLEVIDGNGCQAEANATLGNFTSQSLIVTDEASFCVGGSSVLTASGNFVGYEWSNDELTSSISVDEAGSYSVTATDANGCIVIGESEVIENPLPEPEITGLQIFCEGFTTTLATAESYIEYSWSDNSTTPTIEVGAAGTVAVTVTDANGCIGATQVELTTVTELEPTVIGAEGICPGESVVLYVQEDYDSPVWSTGSVGDSIIVNTAGVYTVNVSAPGGCTGSTSLEVVAYEQPNISIQAPLGLCTGQTANLTVIGSTGDLLWNNGSEEVEIEAIPGGSYSVQLTDENGCITTDAIDIQDWGLPTVSIDAPATFCEGGDAELEVSPTFASYLWSTGSTENVTTISQGALVSVTVTDSNGCVASESTEVEEIPLPVADAGVADPLDCDTEFVSIGGNGSSTGPDLTYQWTGPGITADNDNEPFPQVDEEGVYYLTITNAENCISELDSVLVEDLSYTPDVAAAADDILDCVTFEVTLDGAGSATGQNISYQWFDSSGQPIPNATNLLFEATEAGQYSLQVVDMATACSAVTQVLVEENIEAPSIEELATGELDCDTEEANVSASLPPTGDSMIYSWTAGTGGSIISATNGTDITVDAPAWYYLEVLNELNGCSSLDSAFVDQDITPPTAVTNENQMLFCNDESVSLSGQGSSVISVSYQWFFDGDAVFGATGLGLTASEPGMYTLVVTDQSNGCTASSEVMVSLDPSAPEGFNVNLDPPTCQGDTDGSVSVGEVTGGMSPYMYSFNGQPFSALNNFQQLRAGTYEVVLEDANGCQLTEIVELPDGNNVTLELGPDLRIKEGDPVDIYPQVSIDTSLISVLDWQTTVSLPCPDCLVQEDLYLTESTRFFLEITDENGCPAKDNILIIVERDQNIYVPNGFSPNNDGRNDRFYIFSDSDSVEEIELLRIFNRWGEFVWENSNFQPNDPTAGWDGTVGGMDPNPAVYVWYAEVKMRNGEKLLLKGDVTLVE